MSDSDIKSRPGYLPLFRHSLGKCHLLLSDTTAFPEAAFAEGGSASDFDERWGIARHSRSIPHPEDAENQAFRSTEHLLIALRRRLASETMGFRLYAVGTEPFLWAVFAAAEAAGMSREEISLFASGSKARRVYCNHCRTINEHVTTSITQCAGCRAHLFVRDHFSKRLNAFAGIQVDAEVPGDIPNIEELYS